MVQATARLRTCPAVSIQQGTRVSHKVPQSTQRQERQRSLLSGAQSHGTGKCTIGDPEQDFFKHLLVKAVQGLSPRKPLYYGQLFVIPNTTGGSES